MKKSEISIRNISMPLYALNTLIIGSGTASLNAAVNLFENGQKDIAIVTDRWGGGTSANTGADKQTYYKLSLSGDFADSAFEMANDLFKGGCMHGDIALCEAQNSAKAFFHLASLGVPFPHDRYGAYVGYKTDHDPRQRATSAGPLTAQLMFGALAQDVENKGIEILDRHEIISLLTRERGEEIHVVGAVALDLNHLDSENLGFVVFNAVNVLNYGSSLIDILVYQESVIKGRKVFLDYKENPSGRGMLEGFSFERLSKEAYDYLEKSGALLPTPIERLAKMNQPAIDIYKNQNIDITKEYLEIAVCAQHNNGGLKGNHWWESNVKHLFPVGEANGTHGVYRPGGTALNSGQVGSLRAALYISKRCLSDPMGEQQFFDTVAEQIKRKFEYSRKIIDPSGVGKDILKESRSELQERMSAYGALIRNQMEAKRAITDAWGLYSKLNTEMKIASSKYLPAAFKNLDLCLTHALYLEAIGEYLEKGGKSRGSYLVMDPHGEKPNKEMGGYQAHSRR